MKAITPELLAFLNSSRRFLMADLFDFTLADGTVLRYTGFDRLISYDGQVYRACGVIAPDLVYAGDQYVTIPIQRSAISEVAGLQVDRLDITLYPKDRHLINGLPWRVAAAAGAMRNAALRLQRAYFDDLAQPAKGAIIRFVGNVAPQDLSALGCKLTVKSDAEIFNRQLPRLLFQPGCAYTLFEAGCGLNPDDWAVAGQVAAGAGTRLIPCDLVQEDGWFEQGEVLIAGARRTVETYTVGQLVLSQPLLSAPAAGTPLTAWPGCDQSMSCCQDKFNNLANFQGQPYTPRPETAY